MLSVSCKEVEPALGNEHRVKGITLEDLKMNMRSHLRETHPEIEFPDEEMHIIDSRIESEADNDAGLIEE